MARFRELGVIRISDSTDGWIVPDKRIGYGCLCTDGSFSNDWGSNNDIVYVTLEDAFNAAAEHYLKHNKGYGWWLIGNATVGWTCTSNDGIHEIKQDRSFSAVVEQVSEAIKSQVMKF